MTGKVDFLSEPPIDYCPDESVMKMLRSESLLAKMDMDSLYPPAKSAVGEIPVASQPELSSRLSAALLVGQSLV